MATSTSHRMQQIRRAFKRCTTSTQRSGSPNALVAACPSQCCPGLLIGVNAFSKTVHIVAKFSEDSDSPLRVSRLSRETSPVPREITGRGYLPHYCVDADQQDAPSMYTSGTAPSSQTSAEPANAASNTSLAVYEDVHAAPCTQATSDDDAGGGIGCINIATLLSVLEVPSSERY